MNTFLYLYILALSEGDLLFFLSSVNCQVRI